MFRAKIFIFFRNNSHKSIYDELSLVSISIAMGYWAKICSPTQKINNNNPITQCVEYFILFYFIFTKV